MKKKAISGMFIIVLVALLVPQKETIKNEFFKIKSAAPYEWDVSSPEEQGLDSGIFETAFKEVETMPYLHSLVVIRNGFLVAERYFYFHDKNDASHISSISKSIISALIGIALKEQYLSGLDQKMLDFFPEYTYPTMDPVKHNITLRHLLTMTSGYPNVDTDELWDQFLLSSDWLAYGINLPLVSALGERWQFSTTSTHLLSGIITKAAGMNTLEFAKKYLFEPLKISVREWIQDPLGYYAGGFGMYVTPRDIARFAYLYLNKGVVDGEQIVPAEWVEESLQPVMQTTQSFPAFDEEGYGYLWYSGQMSEYDVYLALGDGGQTLINIPELNMVIVTTADAGINRYDSQKNTNSILDLIAYRILYPLRDWLGPAPYSPLKVSGSKITNRSLTQVEYINIIKWQTNPRNKGENISKYKIYLLTAGSKQLLAEVEANTCEYWQRGVEEDRKYIYGISSVTGENKESTPAFVFVHYPGN